MTGHGEAASRLISGLGEIGIPVREESVRLIMRHLELVLEWNERVNLTAITSLPDMIVKHAIDSASLLRVASLGPSIRLLDVGSGAGFPGVTLKCLVPEIGVTFAESLGKRCRFLEAVGEELFPKGPDGSVGFDVVWARAEDLGQDSRYRERFNLVVARAVAELRVLSEYCLPFVRPGGFFVAMKGSDLDAELALAESAIAALGGEVSGIDRFELPFQGGRRTLVRIEKTRSTPRQFPRKAGTPAKSPL